MRRKSTEVRTFCAGILLTLSGCIRPVDPAIEHWTEALPAVEPSEVEGVSYLDISRLVELERRKTELPALAGGVLVGDTLLAMGVSGRRRANDPDPVQIHDKWHIGSITKSLTGTLTAVLIEEGVLKWDTTVGEVLDEEGVDPAWDSITALDLIQQRGGAPEPNLLWHQRGRTLETTASEERLKWALTEALSEPPRTREFRYTNGNSTLLGTMLERLTGEDWEDLLQTRVFEPLELESAGFGAPLGRANPWGHGWTYGGPHPIMPGVYADNAPLIGPAGTVHLSLPDLARYGKTHLEIARGESPLWQGETFQQLHAAPSDDARSYAAGWVIDERPFVDGALIHHNGSNSYWYAQLAFAPEENQVFFCATNYFWRSQSAETCEVFFKHLAHFAPIWSQRSQDAD